MMSGSDQNHFSHVKNVLDIWNNYTLTDSSQIFHVIIMKKESLNLKVHIFQGQRLLKVPYSTHIQTFICYPRLQLSSLARLITPKPVQICRKQHI